MTRKLTAEQLRVKRDETAAQRCGIPTAWLADYRMLRLKEFQKDEAIALLRDWHKEKMK